LAVNLRYSSTVCNIGRNVSSRNEAKYIFAIASESEAVPRRSVKCIVVSFRPSDLQRPTLSIDQKPLTLLLGGPIAPVSP
jgi:hypothetical protein